MGIVTYRAKRKSRPFRTNSSVWNGMTHSKCPAYFYFSLSDRNYGKPHFSTVTMKISALFVILSAVGSALALPALRMAPAKCPLENRNLLDVVLFIETEAVCRETCR